jgi:GNAT superfamily N-acetyltransferase
VVSRLLQWETLALGLMRTRVITHAERPELVESRKWGEVWPEYNLHGDIINVCWPRLYDELPDYQFFLFDDDEGVVLAKGHCAPCEWDGSVEGLPEGIDDVIVEALALKASENGGTCVTALAIEVPLEHQGKGLSRVMVKAMAEVARGHGYSDLIAPVRPNWKERYPLTPIEKYAHWTRADGLPFDPWIRVHHRLGGEILKPAPQSLRITGSVQEWEQWIGMPLPASGTYVFPRCLAPLQIDRDKDIGSYWEPNVWMRHRL